MISVCIIKRLIMQKSSLSHDGSDGNNLELSGAGVAVYRVCYISLSKSGNHCSLKPIMMIQFLMIQYHHRPARPPGCEPNTFCRPRITKKSGKNVEIECKVGYKIQQIQSITIRAAHLTEKGNCRLGSQSLRRGNLWSEILECGNRLCFVCVTFKFTNNCSICNARQDLVIS